MSQRVYATKGPDKKSYKLAIPITEDSHGKLVLLADAMGQHKTELARRILLDGIQALATTANA